MSRLSTRITLGLSATAVAVSSAVVALGAYFGLRILTPAKRPDERVTVWAIEPVSHSVSPLGLQVWIDGPDADLDGNYSFIFDNKTGHARLGPVIDSVQDGKITRVARAVIAVDAGNLKRGSRGRITGWWFTTAAELGYRTEEVQISTPSGYLTGWLVTPEQVAPGRWSVHVHGRGALPEETLRGVSPLIREGITCLVVNYRNDPGAPAGIRHRYGLGLAERYDVDSAVRWALSQGAQRITLVGWSMGGTTVLLSATRGPYRGWIDGLVLDTPGIDWRQILRTQAKLVGAPAFLGDLGRWAIQRNIVRGALPEIKGTDIDSLTPERFATDLTVPVLIHTGPEDTFVPWHGARKLAAFAPHLVQLRETPGEHVKVWNVEPVAWEHATQEFVRSLADPPAKLKSSLQRQATGSKDVSDTPGKRIE